MCTCMHWQRSVLLSDNVMLWKKLLSQVELPCSAILRYFAGAPCSGIFREINGLPEFPSSSVIFCLCLCSSANCVISLAFSFFTTFHLQYIALTTACYWLNTLCEITISVFSLPSSWALTSPSSPLHAMQCAQTMIFLIFFWLATYHKTWYPLSQSSSSLLSGTPSYFPYFL